MLAPKRGGRAKKVRRGGMDRSRRSRGQRPISAGGSGFLGYCTAHVPLSPRDRAENGAQMQALFARLEAAARDGYVVVVHHSGSLRQPCQHGQLFCVSNYRATRTRACTGLARRQRRGGDGCGLAPVLAALAAARGSESRRVAADSTGTGTHARATLGRAGC